MGFLDRDFTPEAMEMIQQAIDNPKTPNASKFRFELMMLCNKYYEEIDMETYFGILTTNLMGLHYQEMERSKEEMVNQGMRAALGLEHSDADKP